MKNQHRVQVDGRPSGFSLLELLVVVALLMILLGLVVPATSSLLRATGVTNAADQILNSFGQARLAALSKNRIVEVRFYQYSDSSQGDPADTPKIRSFQTFIVEPVAGGEFRTNVLTRLQALPTGIWIAGGGQLSPLLDAARAGRVAGSELEVTVPPAGLNYSAAILRFRPDGSLAGPHSTNLYLTILPASARAGASEPGDNFATVAVEPTTGKARILRQ